MPDKTYGPGVYKDLGGWRQVFKSTAILLLESGAKFLTTIGIGTKNASSAVVVEEQFGHQHRTTLTLTNFPVATVDTGGTSGNGSAPLYTFPRGSIQLLGAVENLTLVAAAGITATAALLTGIGSVAAAADATLTGTEVDFVPSFASTLTGSAGVAKGLGVTGKFFDNTTTTNATQLAARLNFAIPDAGSSANSTITVSGTVTLTWINHGDN